MPFLRISPETIVPTAQAVRRRLAKKAPSPRPRLHRLKPKNQIASSVTGTTPMTRRMRLIAISAIRNSPGLSGLMNRLAMLRDHISSRKETERPSWPRMRMSQRRIAPISVPLARAMKPDCVLR